MTTKGEFETSMTLMESDQFIMANRHILFTHDFAKKRKISQMSDQWQIELPGMGEAVVFSRRRIADDPKVQALLREGGVSTKKNKPL